MHDLFDRVVVHLDHHIFLAADALGDAGKELQLVVIAHLGTGEIVQHLDDLGQALFLRITSSLVGASTYSIRRTKVNGRMMRPYCDCLKSLRSRSALDQRKAAV